jgi:hypothetical protein
MTQIGEQREDEERSGFHDQRREEINVSRISNGNAEINDGD